MSTEKQRIANRTNAAQSTGPRSATGKARTAKNALTHGLCSSFPVLPREPADEWETHRVGILDTLQPVGRLEEALAERVAACLWRLRRVLAYETASTTAGLEEAAESPRDDDRLTLDPRAADRKRLRKVEKELASTRERIANWEDAAQLHERLSGLADDAAVSGDAAEGVLADLT